MRTRAGSASLAGSAASIPRSMRDRELTAAVGSTAHPAAFGQPDFGPGVGVQLTHGEIAIDQVDLTTLVAGDDPRRNAGGTHQNDVGRGVVFAETASGTEQEIVDGMLAEQRRTQGVEEVIFAKQCQRGVGDLAG